jgi:hypothetical protein
VDKVLLHNLVETTETDIIIGTETWRNNSIHSSEIIPTDQYNIFRNDREGSKNNLQFTGWHVTPLGRIIFQVNQSVILFLNAVQQIPIWNIPAYYRILWEIEIVNSLKNYKFDWPQTVHK